MVTPSLPKAFLIAWLPSLAATVSNSGSPITSPAAYTSGFAVWKCSSTRIARRRSPPSNCLKADILAVGLDASCDEQRISRDRALVAVDKRLDAHV